MSAFTVFVLVIVLFVVAKKGELYTNVPKNLLTLAGLFSIIVL